MLLNICHVPDKNSGSEKPGSFPWTSQLIHCEEPRFLFLIPLGGLPH